MSGAKDILDAGGFANGKVVPITIAKKAEAKPELQRVETDLDVASSLLVAKHLDAIRFAHGIGWLAWDGARWERDTRERSRECAKAVAQQLREDAARDNDDALWKLARSLGKARGVSGLLDLARSDPRVRVDVSELDRDAYALNVRNGTVDLRTGVLRAHDRADLITKLAPVDFDPDARAPRFEAFLKEVLPDDEVRGFVQRWAGYAATGVIREHLLLIWYGLGANGKSVLVELLKAVLGDFASAMPESLLVERKHEEHSTEIAQLLGVRMGVSSETAEGCAFNEARVKKLTGGDTVRARFMREEFFDFKPTAKFVVLTNHEPRLRGTDEGIRRRVMLVPFTVQVPPERRDPLLRDRILEQEAAGVLAWIVRGAVDWYARGERVEAPAAVVAATAAYHRQEDSISRFLDDCCERVDTTTGDPHPVTVGELMEYFDWWARKHAAGRMSVRAFAKHLDTAKLGATRKSNGRKVLDRLRLNEEVRVQVEAEKAKAKAGDEGEAWDETTTRHS
jgi:putative DNA primase/helicase